MRILFALAILMNFSFGSVGQNYSKKGLIEIKEQSEAKRLAWNKAFDEAVQQQNFPSLSAIRQSNEAFLDQHITGLRKLYAQGDARGILTSVNNYLQIQRQFVKDVMIPAEALTADNKDAIEKIYQKITDFGQKERIFLVDINNALLTEPDNEPAVQLQPEMNQEEEEEEPINDIKPAKKRANPKLEKSKNERRTKLPHEIMDEGKKNKKHQQEEEE